MSGGRIADSLGVSRTAVWKHVEALRERGYEIESVRSRGYRLRAVPERITSESLASALQTLE